MSLFWHSLEVRQLALINRVFNTRHQCGEGVSRKVWSIISAKQRVRKNNRRIRFADEGDRISYEQKEFKNCRCKRGSVSGRAG